MVASIVCTVIEIVLAAVVTVLVLHPGGEFRIAFCSVDRLADFYTALHNPPDAYCATEAAYPLYSAPLLFYGVSAILVLLVRLPVTALVHDEDHEIAFLPIYIALYYFPVAALVWLIFGGLICTLSGLLCYSLALVGGGGLVPLSKNKSMSVP